jgi:succinoglycan biosynthesis protein ExoM
MVGIENLGAADPKVTIGIVTRERPEGLRRLLTSLRSLKADSRAEARIVVVENDTTGTAERVGREVDMAPWPVTFLAEPQVGIPFARNAVLRAALTNSDFIAFLDDDEAATPEWLECLLHVQATFSADVVAGPVLPRFIEPPPSWVVEGRFFERPRFATGTTITHVGTGNVLIRTSLVRKAGIMFDERLALTGGEDTAFFASLARSGARIVWADEAIVHEWIPPSRVTAPWLVRRAFRGGATYARLEADAGRTLARAAVRLAKGGFRVLQGVGGLVASRGRRPQIVRSLQTIALGMGTVAGVLGLRFDEYRRVHGR